MRPELTLAVSGYNQSAYIEASVRSAFAQTGEPIEIILSDDCSTDDTHARMLALAAGYRGPHQVVVRRNAMNLAAARHFEAIVQEAQGELIVIMAGDDISLPNRVEQVASAWREGGRQFDLLASHVIDMSAEGHDLGVKRVDMLQEWRDARDWARQWPYIIGAAHAVTRRLYTRFGPLRTGRAQEDQVNVLRAICAGGACTIDRALVRYRRGGISSKSRLARDFRAYEERRSTQHVALVDQWLTDARLAGCEALIRDATVYQLVRERFVRKLLDAPDLPGQLAALREAGDVSLRYRLTKLTYLRATRLALLIKHLKDCTEGAFSAAVELVGRRP